MTNELAPWGDGNGTSLDYGNFGNDKTKVQVKTTPILHTVQKGSPEVDLGTAKPGEFVLRIGGKDNPNNVNLGEAFNAVVVARGKEYVWWGDRDSDEGVKARMKVGGSLPEGCDPNDIKWPNEGGNVRADGKNGPVADLTYSFIICPFEDGKLGTPTLLTYSRGGTKTGEQFNILLNAFNGPDYAAVVEFTATKHMGGAKKDKAFYTATPRPVAQIMPEDTEVLETLAKYHAELKGMLG